MRTIVLCTAPVSLMFLMFLMFLVACQKPRVVERQPQLVEVVTVAPGRAEPQYFASGEVRARNESALSFQISGKVVERRVDIGDHVVAGALLARLDAKQQLADVDVSAATLRSAEVGARQASLDFAREQSLLAQSATSQAAYDAAEEHLRSAESSLAAARAALGIVREAASYTELRAPRAGTVIAREIEVGLVARATATAFVLAEDGLRDAVFKVPEGLVHELAGKRVALSLVNDETDGHCVGVVREIAPLVDAATASVLIKVTIDTSAREPALRAPIIGRLALAGSDTVILPAQAMTSDAGHPAVWVVDRNTRVVSLRRIDVYGYAADTISVRSGLNTGDIVVTHGASRLFPAQVVSFNGADSV
ncbi:MAG: hypothetical protein RL701_4301 [Pseudomonadota bacterium]